MQSSGINPVDIIAIVVLLVSALMAFARGFVREVLSIAGWVAAALVTWWAFPAVAPFLREKFPTQAVADGLTLLGLFTLSLIVFSVFTHSLAGRVQESALSAIDRSLGFAFGVLRGAVLVSLAYLFALWLWPDSQPDWLQQARTRPLMAVGAETLQDLMPDPNLDPAQRAAERERRRRQEQVEAQRTLERLANPEPARPASTGGPTSPPGYNTEELGRLEQLIKNTDAAPSAPGEPPAQ